MDGSGHNRERNGSDLLKSVRRFPIVVFAYTWLCEFVDPRRIATTLRYLPGFLTEWYRYTNIPGSEGISIINSQPKLHDKVLETPIDTHYFFSSGWAARRIVAQRPIQHVDVGSHTMFVNMLSALIPVIFADYRPLRAKMWNLDLLSADILQLPFATDSVQSISCLHVAEHVGLGRYGDPLDPMGTRKAATELMRVLAPGGSLYFVVPIGKTRLCFNAHRIHSPSIIREYFTGLNLIEFSAVDDGGNFCEDACTSDFESSRYACGLFRFEK